uniref:Uncharacterized protein n=1 Tax=Eutreptiella gymnastica TaxID=73025 RepID=A0A7S4G7X2_9EUGL|mmetsp:Transcript_38010/g.63151  ORF Transcript_38010/g.63151 Transcript_38010/m.63151 type:complete len:465 (+) Transcript_38010:34-1428(+)
MSLVPTPHQQRPPRRDSRLWKMISFFTGKQAKDHQEEPMPSRALMPREQVASKVQFFESAEDESDRIFAEVDAHSDDRMLGSPRLSLAQARERRKSNKVHLTENISQVQSMIVQIQGANASALHGKRQSSRFMEPQMPPMPSPQTPAAPTSMMSQAPLMVHGETPMLVDSKPPVDGTTQIFEPAHCQQSLAHVATNGEDGSELQEDPMQLDLSAKKGTEEDEAIKPPPPEDHDRPSKAPKLAPHTSAAEARLRNHPSRPGDIGNSAARMPLSFKPSASCPTRKPAPKAPPKPAWRVGRLSSGRCSSSGSTSSASRSALTASPPLNGSGSPMKCLKRKRLSGDGIAPSAANVAQPTHSNICQRKENMVPAKRLKARESMATQLKPKPKIDPSHWSRRLTTATTKHTVPKAPLRTATTNKDEASLVQQLKDARAQNAVLHQQLIAMKAKQESLQKELQFYKRKAAI